MKRLFIADNSAGADGLGGADPTLTTQALATDDRVTMAVLRRGH